MSVSSLPVDFSLRNSNFDKGSMIYADGLILAFSVA